MNSDLKGKVGVEVGMVFQGKGTARAKTLKRESIEQV